MRLGDLRECDRQGSCVCTANHKESSHGADMNRILRATLTSTIGLMAVASGAYAGYVGLTWLRYGNPAGPRPDDADPLLDRFMPVYDVAERHDIDVAAPADVTFAAACEQDLMALPLARAIFTARGPAGDRTGRDDPSARAGSAHEVDWLGRPRGNPGPGD